MWWSAQVAQYHFCVLYPTNSFSRFTDADLGIVDIALNDRLSGPDRTRTRHPRSANAMLSQMSYWPVLSKGDYVLSICRGNRKTLLKFVPILPGFLRTFPITCDIIPTIGFTNVFWTFNLLTSMPKVGLEPTHHLRYLILSQAWLPLHHSGVLDDIPILSIKRRTYLLSYVSSPRKFISSMTVFSSETSPCCYGSISTMRRQKERGRETSNPG